MLTQEYRPAQVQPRSSTARAVTDRNGDYAALDKVDAEASSILISLANHEPRVLENDIKATQRDTMESKKSANLSSGNVINSQSSMSISSLVGSGSDPSSSSSALTWHSMNDRKEPRVIDDLPRNSSSSSNSNNINNKLASDPIMLLAAAAAAVDGRTNDVEQQQQQQHARLQKLGSSPPPPASLRARSHSGSHNLRRRAPVNYYEQLSDDQDEQDFKPTQTMSSDRWRRQEDGDGYLRRRPSGGNTGSYHQRSKRTADNTTTPRQYVSMKHDPRIKRNAMHAYITYMIFNDMTRADRPGPRSSQYSVGRIEKAEPDSRHFTTVSKYESSGPARLGQSNGYQYTNGRDSSNAQTYSPVTASIPSRESWQQQQQQQQTYPSPLERSNTTSSMMSRPLTTFLHDNASYVDRRMLEPYYAPAPPQNLAASTSTLTHR